MMLIMMLLILTPCTIRKNKKNSMTPNTDSPENDAPDTADDDAASPDYLILD